ncbi:MAG: glycine-rich domain-containing protein-like [Telluria sp.]|nr:glycine-rich domain-containing protein-like [Telluria sp.]
MISNDEFKTICELDLDAIKFKLMHAQSGEGWTPEQASAVEFEYRRFLYLMKMHPNEQIVPTVDVDTFWHYHILDTMKYAADCQQAFGYFLHHYPYLGMGDDHDDDTRAASAERSSALYRQAFGESAGGAGDTAYCASAVTRDAYCASAVTKAAYCASAVTKASYCASAVTRDAYCVSAVTNAAYCASAATRDLKMTAAPGFVPA